jgi:hypothetical protein
VFFAQKQLLDLLFSELREQVSSLRLDVPKGWISSEEKILFHLHQIRGFLRDVRDEERGTTRIVTILKDLLILISAIEIAIIMGVGFATDMLENMKELKLNATASQSESERLTYLKKELQKSNKDSRILVFTVTRESARTLHLHLVKEFPELNPQIVVGHGGLDGQDWHEGQKVAIDAFNSGRCIL